MATHCSICGCRKDDDEYVSCTAHSFGEVEEPQPTMNQIPNIEWEEVTWNVLSNIQTGRMSLAHAQEKLDTVFHQQLQKARVKALQEAVDLADKIELQEPDGGTRQWMAFKAFRNTLRDRIKDHSERDQDKK